MNVNQIINMIIRQVMRRFISKGIDAGVNMATRRNDPSQDPDAARRQQVDARDAAKRAKQAMRAGRGIGRP